MALDALMAANGTPWCKRCESFHAGDKHVDEPGVRIEPLYGPSPLMPLWRMWRAMEYDLKMATKTWTGAAESEMLKETMPRGGPRLRHFVKAREPLELWCGAATADDLESPTDDPRLVGCNACMDAAFPVREVVHSSSVIDTIARPPNDGREAIVIGPSGVVNAKAVAAEILKATKPLPATGFRAIEAFEHPYTRAINEGIIPLPDPLEEPYSGNIDADAPTVIQ